MNNKDEKEISLDILKHIENLSNSINEMMASKTQAVFLKYPVTFGLLILVGVLVMHEGLKGVLKEFGVLDMNPWFLLVIGLAILIFTGTLYKKLDK